MSVTKSQIRLPEDIAAWLKQEAEANERSMNGQLIWILKQEMARKAAK